MATINAVILPGKALKGGRHKVRISVAHNGEFRYILTDIIIDSAKEFKNGQIVKRPDAAALNTKLRGLLQKCQRAIDELDYIDGLTCPELVFQIKNADHHKNRTLQSVCEEYLDYARITDSTRTVYEVAFNSIRRHLGSQILVDKVSHTTILSIDKYMRSQRLRPATIRFRMVFLRTLLNYAIRCGYVRFATDPFFGYNLPRADIRQSWLSVDEVRAIRDYDAPTNGQRLTKDLFLLSYYLGGINMVDLQEIDFDVCKKRLRYERHKTQNCQKLNKYVEFDIPDEAKEIIARRKGADGRLALTKRQRADHCHGFIIFHIGKIATALQLPNLIYYSARKSFSQHAFELGVGTSVIDYILGHSIGKGGSSLYSYINVTPELATAAIKKVLENLR